ncbi:phosphatidylinositol-specific phospholipase C1-like protein [Flavivirga spongiicola]|uniref:Phosphatidylinositol-specific phospholipase C1-like protein n=1 Tax=Flavivirga spongiicola TaxID=421621 RepID=A0ABU7XTA5_9FLAO|nr:phosphatidylinositol-specific phospholipase C1-like protein [Flavivirga sp. MEBiC05379]MDO5979011.1 phosphatidylinositol-specific phospholipase C1-like protein [Flavivirga sp. MEBiC05379]
MKRNSTKIITLLLFSIIISNCKQVAKKEVKAPLRINNIQVIGSHNSFKQKIEPALLKLIEQETSQSFEGLQYGHLSFTEQLENYNLRNLEIDIVYDPKGGRYAKPLGLELLKQKGIATQPYDKHKKLEKPGFKAIHVPDIDFRSNCLRFIDCLQEIKDWSDSHPEHVPICITSNAKSDNIDKPGFTKLLPFTTEAFNALDSEILSVFPKDRIIKPDDVRGNYNTLEEAVRSHNWPKLEDARGKVMFVLDEGGEKMEAYLKGHPSLKGRVMFVAAPPGTPQAAFIIRNYPIRDQDTIKALVKAGYMVRTRADEDTKEARKGDYTRFKAALSSGAQFISTDYYEEDKSLGTDYKIKMPNGVIARYNPVLNQEQCAGETLE